MNASGLSCIDLHIFYTIISFITSYFVCSHLSTTTRCTGSIRRPTAYRLHGHFTPLLAVLIACDALNARTVTGREYHYPSAHLVTLPGAARHFAAHVVRSRQFACHGAWLSRLFAQRNVPDACVFGFQRTVKGTIYPLTIPPKNSVSGNPESGLFQKNFYLL